MNTPSDYTARFYAELASSLSYLSSGALIVGKFMDYLNNYAAAFGVLLGVMTFLVNLYFNIANHRALKRSMLAQKELSMTTPFDELFDKELNHAIAAQFERSIDIDNNGITTTFNAVFNANQSTDKMGNGDIPLNRYSIEFSADKITELNITRDSIFIINGRRYKYAGNPFIDAAQWAVLPLTVTS